ASGSPSLPDALPIFEGELHRGAVEGTRTRQQLPGLALAVEGVRQGLLGLVPDFVGTHPLLGAGGEAVDHLVKTEIGVDVMEKVDKARHLGLDLSLGAE